MKMRLLLATLLTILAVTLAVACGQAERGSPAENANRGQTEQAPAQQGTTSGAAEPSGGATTGAGTEASGEAPAEGPPFTAAPDARGGEPGAAGSIAEIRFGKHEGYERAVIEFGDRSDPGAGPPEYTFSSPTGEGYSRITFPGVDSTAVSGGSFGGSIMDGFYVVRAPGGGLFVDIFATGAFQYRILELPAPSRLVIDYRPSSTNLARPLPARSERTVLMEPRRNAQVGSKVRFSGYSRNFEGSTTAILRAASGEVLAEQTVQANDWSETWGYFEGSLDVPPFEGEATLQVGSESPRTGTFEGVEIPVTYGG